MNERADTVARICGALLNDDKRRAELLAATEYPFIAAKNAGRKYSEYQMTVVFTRDGFIDRYSGARLVFPGTLHLLSRIMPDQFPAHPNWKMSESHIVYWELFPTVDHVVPVARGGRDDETNWVTTSMLRNSAKSNWTLEELRWRLLPPGDCASWDGLLSWFLAYLKRDQSHFADHYISKWHRAAERSQTRQI